MLSMLIFDRNSQERKLLIGYSRDAVAYCSDDYLEIRETQSREEINYYIINQELMDAAFLDVCDTDGIEASKQIREAYHLSDLLLIADASVSPMEYMTPDICAASLLLRPFSTEQGKKVIEQFFRAFYRKQNSDQTGKKMLIKNRDGNIGIPYSQIYYIEVRGKKIFIRLKEKEYSKYDSMEHVMEELPDQFIRCHRSYTVNKEYIVGIRLSNNLIMLEDDIIVPLSRRYKADMKAYMKEVREKGRREN